MKKRKVTLIGSIALTLIIGCGLIAGGAMLASWAMGSDNEPAPTGLREPTTTGRNEPVFISQAIPPSRSTETTQQIDADYAPPEPDRIFIGTATNGSGQTVTVEYYFDESERTLKANITVEEPDNEVRQFAREGEEAERFVIRVIGQDEYDLWARQVGASTSDDRLSEAQSQPSHVHGNLSESKITGETAIASAIRLLKEKYALRQETIDRFTVTAEFYTVYEDVPVPVWWVNLDPTISSDFYEIGCYWALIDSSTGEAVGLFSAVDGRG